MNEVDGADGPSIAPEVAARLTEVAARLAADYADPEPASAVAVATTHAKALGLVMGYRARPLPGDLGAVPVYVVTMTGRFESPRASPATRLPLPGSYLTVVVEAATLQLRDVGVGDRDPHARLSRLGPVTRLAW